MRSTPPGAIDLSNITRLENQGQEMRTSGAASETNMTIVVMFIAFGLLILFAGGPREFLLDLQGVITNVGSFLFAAFQSFRV